MFEKQTSFLVLPVKDVTNLAIVFICAIANEPPRFDLIGFD